MKEKQVLAVVFFGDIKGFRFFSDKINNPEEEYFPFWRDWQAIIDDFEDTTNCWVKRLGDGLYIVKEINAPEREVACMLNKTWRFMERVKRLIKNKLSPKPDGFRFRAVFGYIWKVPYKKNQGTDYIGSVVNLTEKILHVNNDVDFICHQSVIERLSKAVVKKNGFVFKNLDYRKVLPENQGENLCRSLYSFEKKK